MLEMTLELMLVQISELMLELMLVQMLELMLELMLDLKWGRYLVIV